MHACPLVASRLKHFFREDGSMPEAVSLSFARPQGFLELSSKEFATLVLDRIRAAEELAAAERHRARASILGRRCVLEEEWRDCPASQEPRRQLNPQVAARSKWSRIEGLLRGLAQEIWRDLLLHTGGRRSGRAAHHDSAIA